MSFGINGTGATNISNINSVINSSSFSEAYIMINNLVYDGWLFFILLITLWIILFFNAYRRDQQLLSNLALSGAIVSFLSLFLRVMYMVVGGVYYGLITDVQLYIFPLLTIIFAWMNHAGKE